LEFIFHVFYLLTVDRVTLTTQNTVYIYLIIGLANIRLPPPPQANFGQTKRFFLIRVF